MTAPSMPHVEYALQSNGDVNTLLSWLGVDTSGGDSSADSSSSSAESAAGSAAADAGGQAATPPVDQMPHLQQALQSNGDLDTLLSSIGVDVDAMKQADQS